MNTIMNVDLSHITVSECTQYNELYIVPLMSIDYEKIIDPSILININPIYSNLWCDQVHVEVKTYFVPAAFNLADYINNWKHIIGLVLVFSYENYIKIKQYIKPSYNNEYKSDLIFKKQPFYKNLVISIKLNPISYCAFVGSLIWIFCSNKI